MKIDSGRPGAREPSMTVWDRTLVWLHRYLVLDVHPRVVLRPRRSGAET